MPSNNKISVVTLLQAYRLLTNVITYQLFISSNKIKQTRCSNLLTAGLLMSYSITHLKLITDEAILGKKNISRFLLLAPGRNDHFGLN